MNPAAVELQLAQEQYVRIVITEDIMNVVALIVIVRKMVTECYKVESIFFYILPNLCKTNLKITKFQISDRITKRRKGKSN